MRFLILPEVKHQEMVVFVDIILHEYSLMCHYILRLCSLYTLLTTMS
jgi:hypothetical protein